MNLIDRITNSIRPNYAERERNLSIIHPYKTIEQLRTEQQTARQATYAVNYSAPNAERRLAENLKKVRDLEKIINRLTYAEANPNRIPVALVRNPNENVTVQELTPLQFNNILQQRANAVAPTTRSSNAMDLIRRNNRVEPLPRPQPFIVQEARRVGVMSDDPVYSRILDEDILRL